MPAVRLRKDYSAEALRALARRSKDVNQSRRLLSLAAVLDGMDRGSATRIGGMDRQTLRDWVHRFNAAGPDGERDGVVRWPPGGPQTGHRGAVRRRLPRALRRKAPQEARLLAHERKASPSGPGRADCRSV